MLTASARFRDSQMEKLQMGRPISINIAGLVVAAMIGGWHLGWSALVALGLAQPIMAFVFWMHFIKPVYVVESFAFNRAILLVVVTSAIGYALGSIFALAWNA